MLLAAVALSEATRSFDKLYHYKILPDGLKKAAPGMRVIVPFGRKNQLKSGWIIEVWEGEESKNLKQISQIVDETPLLSAEMIKLVKWIRTRYFCTWGDAIRLMIPAGISLKRQSWLVTESLADNEDKTEIELSPSQKSILEKILKSKNGIPEQEFGKIEKSSEDIEYLIEKGLVKKTDFFEQSVNEKTVKAVIPSITKEEFYSLVDEGKVRSIHHIRIMEVLFTEEICSLQDILLIAGVSHGTIRNMAKKGWVSYTVIEVERNPFDSFECETPKELVPTDEQANVLKESIPLLSQNKLNEILIHGVTGSGKTEIYIRLIEEVIKTQRTAIMLVPEISLTPQMISCFRARFGNKIAIQHSRLSQGERFDQWRKIKAGEVDVVIGVRSAVFAPLSNLGIIIIDEEHELTYKSENTPKYDARQVARARCNINSALLVLGSATPSVETYYRALSGKTILLTMKNRPNSMSLPQTVLVDLREELKEGNRNVLSRKLEEELVKNKNNQEQSILFLNKRGYASFMLCRDCGYTLKCPNCSVSLTVHTHDRQIFCHYCGYSEPIQSICPKCQSDRIKAFGTGTQKVEEELKNHPAMFSVLRMDADTTSGKHGHKKLLNAFRNKEADILLGTQMVAKGHDFPDVTLVGILSADASLFTNDYRASERTFQLITQASGRAGRGEKPGRVVLQAYNIDDYAIQTAMNQDFETFYQKEIIMRKIMNSPPFCHIGVIIVSSENQNDAKDSLAALRSQILDKYKEKILECSEVLPPPIFIIRNRYRWRIIVKTRSVNVLVQLMNDVLDMFPKCKTGSADVSVDIDPVSMV
ncbi:MAG TPA: primosomal protein N' [Clostridiaceae bacterium]|nr:primosomal protein N' [Clostridiaceae bacterium]